METLRGEVAVISGGLGDIGRAIARELARRGADIALGDILPEDRATDFLAELAALGRRARYARVDVADAAAVRLWVGGVEEGLGLPSLIIPNAAVVTAKNIRELAPEEFLRELQVNLCGAFHLAQSAALGLLRRHKPGRIVLVGSWVAHAAQTHIPAYCVSKAGLRMLGKCLARDLASAGILVNEVQPGNVDAGLSGKMFQGNPALREQCRQTVPIGVLMQPEDVAFQVAHLCEPSNRHMTGAVLVADGGLSLCS